MNSLVSLQLCASSSIGCAPSTHRNDARSDECVPRPNANGTTYLPTLKTHLQSTATRTLHGVQRGPTAGEDATGEKQTARFPSAATGRQDVCTRVTRTNHVNRPQAEDPLGRLQTVRAHLCPGPAIQILLAVAGRHPCRRRTSPFPPARLFE